MKLEIVATLIAFVGVVLSTTISLIIGFWGKRYNYHHLFAETVSQSRNKWLNEMREYISEMLANKRRMVYGNIDEKSVVEICNNYDTCKFQVLMRLNINESDHRQLRALIIELDGYGAQRLGQKAVKQYEETELEIIEISRKILKEEWDKVKLESKGKGKIIHKPSSKQIKSPLG